MEYSASNVCNEVKPDPAYDFLLLSSLSGCIAGEVANAVLFWWDFLIGFRFTNNNVINVKKVIVGKKVWISGLFDAHNSTLISCYKNLVLLIASDSYPCNIVYGTTYTGDKCYAHFCMVSSQIS